MVFYQLSLHKPVIAPPAYVIPVFTSLQGSDQWEKQHCVESQAKQV
jgi:hypothetical protein